MRSPWPPNGASRPSIRERWSWFVGIGIVAMLCGLVALLLVTSATVVSVMAVGALMIVTGVVEMAIGFKARTWGRALYWEVAGLIYIVAGSFAIAEPVPASAVITLILGAGLIATGLVRLGLGFKMHDGTLRVPLMFGAAFTALLGLAIVVGWPANSLVVIGTLLGVDLMFNGINWIVFGTRLRSAP